MHQRQISSIVDEQNYKQLMSVLSGRVDPNLVKDMLLCGMTVDEIMKSVLLTL
jgi:hypothetical protein